MNINVKECDNSLEVICSGNIDNEGEISFAQTLDDIRKKKGFDKIIFNMRDVNLIISSGIARLIMFYKLMESTERTMEILVSDMLYKQFHDIHLHRIISISNAPENRGVTC
jgi:anti-anti-sigma factor